MKAILNHLEEKFDEKNMTCGNVPPSKTFEESEYNKTYRDSYLLLPVEKYSDDKILGTTTAGNSHFGWNSEM